MSHGACYEPRRPTVRAGGVGAGRSMWSFNVVVPRTTILGGRVSRAAMPASRRYRPPRAPRLPFRGRASLGGRERGNALPRISTSTRPRGGLPRPTKVCEANGWKKGTVATT